MKGSDVKLNDVKNYISIDSLSMQIEAHVL